MMGRSSRPNLEVLADIRKRLLAEPEVREWPAFAALVERSVKPHSKPSWEYPLHACRAVGSTEDAAYPAAAAIFCMLYSIHLVDDLLDSDPDGIYHEVGIGTAANLAVAFQGLAARIVDGSSLSPHGRAAVQASIGGMALATAYGQNLDASDSEGEEQYWRVLSHKTPPLFGCGLEIGALYGGADPEAATRIGSLGDEIGKIVQINDDLKDALEVPASADWQRQWTNLPILFARIADYPEKEQFLALIGQVEDEEALRRAQKLLIESGSVSYCAYHVIEAYKRAMSTIESLDLANAEALVELIDVHVFPLRQLLETLGVEGVDRIFSI